ncbi:nesprin-4 isoform X4 [Panthera uncia]|uniref:nesprin-4 isoform X4 n=1 Tax=Panthera uncia TaxID=29064 RepID=UPI0020FF91DB|nr:nesprin-4 isoform X4 [Panthera uncia]
MALPPPLGPRFPSEPLNYPAGAPRELDIARCTICPASGEKRIRPKQAQKLGQDSLDPPEHFQGGLRGTEPAAGPLRLPAPSSSEDPAGGRHREHLISGQEVLEAEQDSLSLCLLGPGLRLQDLEQGLGPWASAQSGMVQLQALQADLCGAAERVDALLAFGEGLAQRSEPQARASLEQVLRALRAHRDGIFRRLWWLQAQLVSYSLVWPTLAVPTQGTNSTTPVTLSSDQVFEEASTLDQDLEVEGDLDGPGPGGAWGPWAPSSLPTPAELEWDPAGDVGGLRPLGRKTAWTPGAPCELCGHRVPEGRGQGLENSHTFISPQDMLMSGFSHRKHLAGQRRRSLVRKPQDKKQASPNLQDVMLEVDPGAPPPASRWSLTFLILFLFLLLVGATLLLPPSGGSCCSPARLARTPHLVLSYVNGPPPV